jgi:hypothetical protein
LIVKKNSFELQIIEILQKANLFKNMYFLHLCICQLETELNLDPDSNPDPELITDPDPNLQIISDPAGSGCTTLKSYAET